MDTDFFLAVTLPSVKEVWKVKRLWAAVLFQITGVLLMCIYIPISQELVLQLSPGSFSWWYFLSADCRQSLKVCSLLSYNILKPNQTSPSTSVNSGKTSSQDIFYTNSNLDRRISLMKVPVIKVDLFSNK